MSKKTTTTRPNAARKVQKKASVKRAGKSVAKQSLSKKAGIPADLVASARSGKKARGGSKQARVIAILQSADGVTIHDIMRETAWQQHSVRGFLAGVVRKKLGFDLISQPGDNGRVYRIKEPRRSSSVETNSAA